MTITLTEKQSKAVVDFFQINNAAGHTEDLLEIFEGYLMSSNDDIGIIPSDSITTHFYTIRMLIGLIKTIEPENVFQL